MNRFANLASLLRAPAVRWSALAIGGAAALSTVVWTWPVAADTTTTGIDIPDSPLITDTQVPPNILFILDDSGSMQYDYMPDDVPSVGTTSASSSTNSCSGHTNSTDVKYLACSAYPRNTVYYNPATDYEPWMLPDGSRMTGGTDYTSAYSDAEYVTYSGEGPTGSGTVSTSSSTTDLSSSVRTYYVPKDTTSTDSDSYLAIATNYYRYQILTTGEVYRSEYLAYSSSNTTTTTTTSGDLATSVSVSSGSFSSAYTLTLPSGVSSVTFSSSASSTSKGPGKGTGNSGTAYLYVKLSSAVSNTSDSSIACSSTSNSTTQSCSITSPSAGTYYVNLYGGGRNSASGITISYSYTVGGDTGCDTSTSGYGWRNCTEVTPTGRTEEEERTNYATWYSYHRTRTKAAKAGASEAFGELGDDVRVGFRTIWGRDNSNTSGNIPTQDVPIPVNYNDGLFSDTGSSSNDSAYNNRTQWYNRLFAATASSSTPLRGALEDAGSYFSSSSSNGPYGPESESSQLACRQNFSILTTDGYWNESYSSSTIANSDNTAGSTISSSSGDTYTYSPTDPYKDSYSSTLADVAMYYWKGDLRTDLDNSVPTSSDDPAFWQHMTTFAIAIGLSGTVDQTSVDEVVSNGVATTNDGANSGWPQPVNNTVTTIDDLLHAAVNGHGEFVAATDPDEFATGLQAALASITERTGSFANVTATSATVESTTQIFSASYVSGTWSGQLIACAATESSCSTSNANWKATAQMPDADDRNIFTFEDSAGATFPTSTQEDALGGEDVADYLRGDQSNELQNDGTYRNRSTVLGDIVDSSPTYVSATDTVYVGANDGMLHAFDASSGEELFAYVPGALDMEDLATLADTDYSHLYSVDGPIVVSTQSQTTSQNILAGTLGRGGKGIYALDVTNPTNFTSSDVLWEATETSGGNMGKILGQPFIAKLNNGVTALVTGNGLNSSTGHAVLLVYNLKTGDLITEIDTGSGGTTTATTNGLGAPSGYDEDGDGTVDYVYAGDLQGHVWKFDLSDTSAGAWDVDNGGDPLFSATDDDGTAQPITGGLLLAEHPSTGDIWVFFGTGRYLTSDDIEDVSVQSLYGFIDSGSTVSRSDLTEHGISATGTSSGYSVRSFDEYEDLPDDSQGWYINLLTDSSDPEGERVVTAPSMSGTTLVVTSIIPSGSACESSGTSWINALSAFTGTATQTSYFDLNGDGSTDDDTLTDSDGNTVAVGSVAVTSGMASAATLLNGKAVYSTSGGTTESLTTATTSAVRVSWREVMKDE